jgi:hypothetical protein
MIKRLGLITYQKPSKFFCENPLLKREYCAVVFLSHVKYFIYARNCIFLLEEVNHNSEFLNADRVLDEDAPQFKYILILLNYFRSNVPKVSVCLKLILIILNRGLQFCFIISNALRLSVSEVT